MSLSGKSTRSRIIEAARCLFWLNGYGLTTINQILERAHVNPGTFYRLFRTKENLLLTVLHNHTRGFVPNIVEPLFKQVSDPILRIFAILDVYRRNLVTSEFSCGSFVGKLALEIHSDQTHLHQRIALNFDDWTATIEQCLEQARHRIPEEMEVKPIATFVLATMEGAVMLARAHKSLAPFEDALKNLRFHFVFLETQRFREEEDKADQQRQAKKARRRNPAAQHLEPITTPPNAEPDANNQSALGSTAKAPGAPFPLLAASRHTNPAK